MARIEAAPRSWRHPLVRLSRAYAKRTYKRELELVEVTAHHPRLFVGYGMVETMLDRSKTVDARLKDLAATKAAMLVGCEFCLDIGSHLSREAGASEQQLRDLPRYRESDAFSEVEKLVIELAERMTRTPVEVPDEFFARLREHFDEPQLVELTTAIALENYRARFNDTFDMRPAEFSQGDYCVRAESVVSDE